MTFNIRHAEGMDGEVDLERVIEVIRALDPDVVALQEVDRTTARAGGVDQAMELGDRTGLEPMHGPNLELEPGEYGNAILSRWPFHEVQNLSLPRTAGGEQRGMLAVRVMADGEELLLASTHLDHREDDAERRAGASAIAAFAAARGELPMILGGDLNDAPDSATLGILTEGWGSASAGRELATFPADEPERQLDYVLFHPADRWRVVECRVIDAGLASDHRPLFAVLELLPGAD